MATTELRLRVRARLVGVETALAAAMAGSATPGSDPLVAQAVVIGDHVEVLRAHGVWHAAGPATPHCPHGHQVVGVRPVRHGAQRIDRRHPADGHRLAERVCVARIRVRHAGS